MFVQAKAEVIITGQQPGIIHPGIQDLELLRHLNIRGPVPAALIKGPGIASLLQVAEVPTQGLLPAAEAGVHIQDRQLQGVVRIIVRQVAREAVTAGLQAAQEAEVIALLQEVQGVAAIVHLQEVQEAAVIVHLQGVQEAAVAIAGPQAVRAAAAVTAVLQVVLQEAVADHEAAAQDLQAHEVAAVEDNIIISD